MGIEMKGVFLWMRDLKQYWNRMGENVGLE